jgi:site-specific DNA-methyltransferase (adenine-specific)
MGSFTGGEYDYNITKPATDQAKKLDGAYCGFQPKPAVEIILVTMKPLSEKTYVDQALSNSKGVTWLDDCRIPFNKETDEQPRIREDKKFFGHGDNNIYSKGLGNVQDVPYFNQKGRFPANLIVQNDVLNDGKKWRGATDNHLASSIYGNELKNKQKGWGKENFGSFSRYFDLDSWSKTFPFLIVPKASKSERNKGCENLEADKVNDGRNTPIDNPFQRGETIRTNRHPTVKPLKLMSYLITLGSREGDTILDPFCGSGTTCIAAQILHRNYIGIELNPEYCKIAEARLKPYLEQTKIV